MTDVKLELAKEEAAEAARGIIRSHETSASIFLTVGLELEEQQYGVLSLVLAVLLIHVTTDGIWLMNTSNGRLRHFMLRSYSKNATRCAVGLKPGEKYNCIICLVLYRLVPPSPPSQLNNLKQHTSACPQKCHHHCGRRDAFQDWLIKRNASDWLKLMMRSPNYVANCASPPPSVTIKSQSGQARSWV
jgi:hypothetical protein